MTQASVAWTLVHAIPARGLKSTLRESQAKGCPMALDLSLNYLPRLPQRKDVGIGCVGAGFIMRDCHLVAYRQAGFNPVAITSRKVERAKAVAEQHSIPRVHASLTDLLQDTAVAVLDIAVPPDAQPDVIRQAVQHKDHIRGILAQ